MFCIFRLMFVIFLRVNRTARKMPDCKRFAFLSYFPCLPFLLSLRSVFLYFSLCFAFLSWAPPTPARFLKKAWQKLLPLLPLAHYYLLIINQALVNHIHQQVFTARFNLLIHLAEFSRKPRVGYILRFFREIKQSHYLFLRVAS